MATREGDGEPTCPVCGRAVEPTEPLRLCPICHRRFCARCVVGGFGREFCSMHCRDFFFFGDGEEAEDA